MTRIPPIWKHLLWPACIAVVLFASTRERMQGYATKSCIQHDEVIALMAASCHQGDYERARFDLANHWVPASSWKGLLTTKQVACFGRIRNDLVDHDIHQSAGVSAGYGGHDY